MERTVRRCPHGRAVRGDSARRDLFHGVDAWHWLRRKRRKSRAMLWRDWRVRLLRSKVNREDARVPHVVCDACALPRRHLT
eukprot:6214368-Pleurochrysis_carterae.AAC.7